MPGCSAPNLLHLGGDGGADRGVARARRPRHREGDHRLAVEARIGARLGGRVRDGRELVEAHAPSAGQADAGGGERLEGLRAAEGTDRLLAAADLAAAAGEIDAGQAKLPVDVRGGDAEGEKAVDIELDADLPVDAADAGDAADPADALELPGDDVVDEPREFLGRHRRIGSGVGDDRQAGDLDPLHDRLVDGARQVGADLGDRVLDVVDGAVAVDLEAKLDRRRREAFRDVRDDVLDAVDAGDRILDPLRDLVLQLRRRGAGLRHRDSDDRDVDVRKARDRELPEAEHAQHDQDDEQDDRRNRLPDRPRGDIETHYRTPSAAAVLSAGTGRTTSPSRRKLPALATIKSPTATPS